MAILSMRCETCGPVSVSHRESTLWLYRQPEVQASIQFECPGCEQLVMFPVVELMQGVVQATGIVEYEVHLDPTPDAPAIHTEELLNFHNQLEDDARVARAVSALTTAEER